MLDQKNQSVPMAKPISMAPLTPPTKDSRAENFMFGYNRLINYPIKKEADIRKLFNEWRRLVLRIHPRDESMEIWEFQDGSKAVVTSYGKPDQLPAARVYRG